ncbi:LuxR family transcriptional regulator [Legionella sp. 16cNR16C]|uniref:helix-turn-helix transcriptional regulator n=1 Tax=Legionella sp. 16cNR16C TaxID=2905656 RepID=UPI001E5CABD7|nr:LuxR family transcriptional regulator [Legionella sp. 16cNR16C]MCE3044147.1 LuxR family transcriptional regulator [Legionella sp. 16cNR16C]
MNLKKIYREHPCFSHAQAFTELCEPLKNLGITHFSHVSVSREGRFSFISQNPDFVSHYLENTYFDFDVHRIVPSRDEQYFIRDLQCLTGRTKALQEAFNQHGFGHSFTILRSGNGVVDAYNFATRLGNNVINGQYLEKLDFLKQFLLYFHDKIDTHSDLKKAYGLSLSLQKQNAGFQEERPVCKDALILPFLERVPVPGTGSYLTFREYECMCWLARGKTQQEIADILMLSLRTVKAHVGQVRKKMGCENQFQLGLLLSRLESLITITLDNASKE